MSRLVMYEYGEHSICFQAVVDNPTGTISVPTGEYLYATVALHDDSMPGLWKGFARGPIEIRDDGPTELCYGGPLKNVVTVARSMSELYLLQSVTGIGGVEYSPSEKVDEEAPTYTIRNDGEELVVGKFEYG